MPKPSLSHFLEHLRSPPKAPAPPREHRQRTTELPPPSPVAASEPIKAYQQTPALKERCEGVSRDVFSGSYLVSFIPTQHHAPSPTPVERDVDAIAFVEALPLTALDGFQLTPAERVADAVAFKASLLSRLRYGSGAVYASGLRHAGLLSIGTAKRGAGDGHEKRTDTAKKGRAMGTTSV